MATKPPGRSQAGIDLSRVLTQQRLAKSGVATGPGQLAGDPDLQAIFKDDDSVKSAGKTKAKAKVAGVSGFVLRKLVS